MKRVGPCRIAATFLLAAGADLASPSATYAQLPAGEEEEDDPGIARRARDEKTTKAGSPATPSDTAAPASLPPPPASPDPPKQPITAAVPETPEEPEAALSLAAPRFQPTAQAWSHAPRLKIAYRRFNFVRPGVRDPDSRSGAAEPQPFNSLSLDLYMMSGVIRIGFSTLVALESTSRSSADYVVAESASMGLQRRGKVTPFVEGSVGGGYMRRVRFDVSMPSVYWQFGVDAGAEIYFRGRAFLSVALGYLRPVNGFYRVAVNRKDRDFTSVYVDTLALKIGLGV